MTKYVVIKNWIENIASDKDLISIVRDVNSYNEELDEYNFYWMEELDELFSECSAIELLNKLAPNFDVNHDGFRDTIYGLESCAMQDVVDEIKDNIEEVAESIAYTIDEYDSWVPATLENELEKAE